MSISQPPVEHRQSGPSADDVDGLLRDFFQASLPRPWPAFVRPQRETLPLVRPASWRRRFRSSLALAASVAILALGLGLLPGKFVDRPSTPLPGAGDPNATNVKPGKDATPRGVPQPE